MKAAILHGKEDLRIEDIAPVALRSGEVRIQIEAALTCGTDLKVFRRGYHEKMIKPPAVFGHELAGTVCEVAPLTPSRSAQPPHPGSLPLGGGEGARRAGEGMIEHPGSCLGVVQNTEWHVGDRVVVANSAPCGACSYCRAGQENLCADLIFLNGAYAESIVVPERLARKNLLRLKPETAFRDAALVEPLACVVQGVEDTRLQAGQSVLVLGAGPIGLMFVALAKYLGCQIAVGGRRTTRLEAARRLGAGQVIDIGDGNNLVPVVRDAAKAHFDAVIEAVGKPAVWEAAVQ